MIKKLNIIATVGTSILTNRKSDINSLVEKIKKLKSEDEYKELAKEFTEKEIKNISGNESAELQTILEIIKKYKNIQAFKIYLISSDTNDSYFCAFVDDILLNKLFNNMSVEKIRLSGLCVDNYDKFKNIGINEFLKLINKLNIDNSEEFALCISGGFKGFIPIMTIVAQIFNMKSYYIFEKSNVLIEIPVLPFNFDYEELYDIYTTPNEQNKIDRLKKHGFLDNDNNETVIGNLAKNIYLLKTPYLIEIWGKIVEFLLYEYFHIFSYKTYNNEISNNIKKNIIIDNIEFDLVFYDKNKKIISTLEIKPVRKLYENYDELVNQIKRQINVLKKKRNKRIRNNILFFIWK
ncbi:MAG: putative CRISPR-associated protein [Candidatus Goldbacteria bacterium]|nr:putative CRISPR-associated protein [Candidatus Goldiibacteriota bacterium]